MSARVVAVTTLLLQVLEDLGTRVLDPNNMPTGSEIDFVMHFGSQKFNISKICDEARAEMGAQVVKVLQT